MVAAKLHTFENIVVVEVFAILEGARLKVELLDVELVQLLLGIFAGRDAALGNETEHEQELVESKTRLNLLALAVSHGFVSAGCVLVIGPPEQLLALIEVDLALGDGRQRLLQELMQQLDVEQVGHK